MPNNLPALLAELATIAPDVCQIEKYGIGPAHYVISEYRFWISVDTLCAKYQESSVAGRPALAWLTDALMRECERLEWNIDIKLYEGYRVWFGYACEEQISNSDNLAVAFLNSFIKYAKYKEGRNNAIR